MKIFRADGQPSRDDECDHGFRRFEKCAHCLEAANERLRDALWRIIQLKPSGIEGYYVRIARAALGEKE